MDDQHMDGNGVAGLLGDHRAYRSAGVVLRCPGCQDVAVVIGVQEQRLVVDWRGTFEIAR